ncbi:polysaccharide pyruvyl transferase family protein [Neobacillus sp. LXY-4]|uniref:polysaccharide pyruvyl transferase family protein n=1 Tax=Neobacillus sp. LXY-4 TaxID=3379826 RepID=UPI003EE09974
MNTLIRHIKHYIKYGFLGPFLQYISNEKNLNKLKKNHNIKRIFVMQTPQHGNLGDHGIAYAQKDFLLKNINDFEYIEIPFEEVFKKARTIKKMITSEDLIVIHGGGNIGDMYLYEELTRRFIVSYFKNVRIISFPQTISFSNTLLGKIALLGSKRVYRKNKNFFIVARESKSYEIMKKEFGEEKVLMTPDIVLSLNKRGENDRKGIVTCLRNDVEQKIDNSFKNDLLKHLKEKYQNVKVSDTRVDYRIFISQRNEELQIIWETFRNAEVVLTDRLHGMIFCAITGTPCIVFNNFNHKIEYSYKNWLSHLDYIKFTQSDNIDYIIDLIESLKCKGNLNLTEGINSGNFSTLIRLINNLAYSEKIKEIS